MKKSLLMGASSIILALPCASVAQEAAVQRPAVQAQQVGGDIVVTAQRDRSLLSKTPLAISAVTGDALRNSGITGPSALSDVVPNVSLDHTNGIQVTIRGVTSNDQTEKGDPSAAFMVDGVYIARTQEADVSFYDVDRVEVLRGPQGTLYGRNTTAGVVNVLTNKPELNRFKATVDGSYGNYDAASLQAAVNLPVSSTTAVRIAGIYDRHDNYYKLAPGDTTLVNSAQRENVGARIQVLFKPTSNFNLLLRGAFANIKGTQSALNQGGLALSNFYTNLPSGNSPNEALPVWSNPNPETALVRANRLPTNPGIAGHGNRYGENNTSLALEGEANWDLGAVTLTDITSYHQFSRNETNVLDLAPGFAVPYSNNSRFHQFSQELRVSTNGTGPFHVQAGAYYFREKQDVNVSLFGLLGPAGSNAYVFSFPQSPVINRTWGLFTQGTYKPIPQLRLTAGVRYTNDYKYRYGYSAVLPAINAPLSQSLGYVNDAQISAERVTWRAAIDGDIPSGLLFASVASGYKAGGFGDGCSTGAPGQSNLTSRGEKCVYGQAFQPGAILPQLQSIYYQPETLIAYEAGYKGKFAGGAVRLNVDAFYYDYKNMQLTGQVMLNGAPSQVTTNAGRSHIKGVEVETILQPDRHNRLNIGLDILDASYVQYCAHTLNPGQPTASCDANWAGRRLDRSPATSLRAAYTYSTPIGASRVEATVGTRLVSKSYVTAYTTYPVQYVTPSHTQTYVTVTYHSPDDRWYLQGYGKNLENFIAVNGVDTNGFVTAINEPRTYGVRAGFKF
ncbi:TonB-dependent receptor [Novosphingobium humi]|uniref:TonB-dependent receptor n=1 Tax=Novosphingobium humi TaxID=2282397 RepID=A0ABY7U472_9SPHN|nr:TonB-dependent receptor [Novosphingobium humi]WCT79134.1 TonB-dependent receptor [Novosphingobium humi]